MSRIKISDLSLHGSDLFDDSEGFLEDLVDQQLPAIHGGNSVISQITVSVGLLVLEEEPTTLAVAPLSTVLSDDESPAGIFLV